MENNIKKTKVSIFVQRLIKCEVLPLNEVEWLCIESKKLFSQQPNVLKIQAPVNVVGDIHANLKELLELFKRDDPLPDTQYLFMGNLVNRNENSVECLLLVLSYKILYPDRINMIRGNHECRMEGYVFGLFEELKKKYPHDHEKIFELFNDVFDQLPLAALVSNKIFVVHGGLSPDINKIEDIMNLDRFCEIPSKGPIMDLCWSDPDDSTTGFSDSPRGAGHLWGPDQTEKFCKDNNVEYIIRGHKFFDEGYKWNHNFKVLTLFSCPDFGNRMNKGAFAKLGNYLKCDIVTYDGMK